MARWPHLSHPDPGEPDLVLASAGDLPAERLTALARRLRTEHPHLRLRYVHIHDLTTLAEAGTHPLALPEKAFTELFGNRAPFILATTGYPADVHALLGARHPGARVTVLGYRDPGRPLTQAQLLAHCGLDDDSLWQLATHTALLPTEATAS
ncbi:hypothetical protein ACIRPU_33670 [Streptomyces sp. NPDC102259]|uniref:phosphoketolase family protein n=1 Tax=Streptomyces sp. NPDC102259 TaxID=3366148 RepID=UPI0037FF063A